MIKMLRVDYCQLFVHISSSHSSGIIQGEDAEDCNNWGAKETVVEVALDMAGGWTHELTTAVVACTRSSQLIFQHERAGEGSQGSVPSYKPTGS